MCCSDGERGGRGACACDPNSKQMNSDWISASTDRPPPDTERPPKISLRLERSLPFQAYHRPCACRRSRALLAPHPARCHAVACRGVWCRGVLRRATHGVAVPHHAAPRHAWCCECHAWCCSEPCQCQCRAALPVPSPHRFKCPYSYGLYSSGLCSYDLCS